ncbi:G-protein-coupled receptor family protein [Cavenderia fasciculata]|uniref:G-protein-coupled receptor family protein n=1 Tax=Cavenderia fasciculata TaxID=261658 RepID=F4PSR2_CACFS|nr:G-protein-coupled receptor family protein [Cavenderia fasciculata]EGG21540.1 G-protein-coupled receptor family protein [Cavenderia fasciculata]|eukprot:XP_004359390.1 G-protein-coupled receptor family protein [Cavenderia fasciculata]
MIIDYFTDNNSNGNMANTMTTTVDPTTSIAMMNTTRDTIIQGSNGESNYELSVHQRDILHYVLIGSSCMTLAGTLLVITTYLIKYLKGLHNKEDGAKMIFLLNLPGFIGSFFWFPWESVYNETFCTIQASGIQFCELAALCWSSCIVFTFLSVVLNNKKTSKAPETNFKIFHFVSWGVPLLSLIPCYVFGLFGPLTGPWCWISNPGVRLLVYIPGLAIVLFITISYVYLRIKLGKQDGYGFITGRFFYFILASLICQLPSLVNRVQNYLYPQNPIFVLYLLQSIFQPLQGFINSMVYGIIDEYFFGTYREFFSCFGCCRPKQSFSNGSGGKDTFGPISDHTSLLIDYDNNSQRFSKNSLPYHYNINGR